MTAGDRTSSAGDGAAQGAARLQIGLGTSTLRSLGRRASLPEVTTLLEAAAGAGVHWIDTADTYGAGSAERAIGAAFRRSSLLESERDRFRIITKVGYLFPDLPRPFAAANQPLKRAGRVLRSSDARFDDAYLERAVAGSLRRLGGVRPSTVCLHNPPEDVLRTGHALAALRRVVDRAGVRGAGVSVDDAGSAAVAARLEGVDLLELPAEIWLDLDPALRREIRARGTDVVVNRLSVVDTRMSTAVQRLATADPAPTVAVIGTRNAAHLRSNAETAADAR